MIKLLKVLGFLSVTLVLFFVVSVLAFYHLMRTGEFRRFLMDEIEKQTDLKVQLGEADLEIGWVTGITFGELALTEPGMAQPAITAQRITARVALTPLLQHQVTFYEIRLQKPTGEFVRDKDGRIPLLDKLLNLPFLKQKDSEITLDLRSIKVQNGSIGYTDQRPGASRGHWRLLNAKVDLEHVRGQRLRDFMKELFKQPQSEPAGAALEFALTGELFKDNAKMNLKSRGRLLFPKEALEFHEARWDADVELVDFPATLMQEHLSSRIPIKTMSGHLGQRVHIEGNPEKQLRLTGDLEFKQLSVDAPELFLAPLKGADGRTTFDAEWSPQRLRLLRADVRANDIKFAAQADVRGLDSSNPHYQISLTNLSASLPALRKYLPFKIIASPQLEKTFNAIQGGQLEVTKAGVDATLADLRRLNQDVSGKQVWFEAALRDVVATPAIDGLLSLKGVQGKLSLAGGIVTFHNLKGDYGDSHLSDVDGSYNLFSTAAGKLELQASGDFNLAELREQLKSGRFSVQAATMAQSVEDLAGRGRLNLALKRDVNSPLEITGKANLSNVRVRYHGYALSDINGELAFAPKEIKGENLRAQLSGSPIVVRLALKDYGADTGSFDLAIDSTGVKAGVLTSLLLDTGDLQDPGVVRGTVHYSGSLNSKESRKFTGNLDLVNVQTTVHPLLQPVRELSGKVIIDDQGIDFQNLKALLAGVPANARGRWRYHEMPQLLFDFSAPNLDVTYLISQIDPEASEFYAKLHAEGKISLAKGRIKNFEFSDLKTDATIDRRVWRLSNLTARSSGGTIVGLTTIFDRPETLGVIAEPKIQAVPIQAFLKWFNITNTEMTGNVNLTGKLETTGRNDIERKQNLNGAFSLRIEDGTINRMRLLVQLLNLLDLSRWFTFQLPDLAKQGIRFRSISGDFKVTNGVYATDNLVVNSNDLRMTGVGKIDVPKDELDLVLAVRPFAGIDSAINQIPILGWGVAAIKNSFLVASFNVTGKIDDPTITPAPLGTLSEMFWSVLGIPKNIIGLGGGEKKAEPPEPAKAPTK
jgi:uncharacterized protein involved in outer membrane biogenesis